MMSVRIPEDMMSDILERLPSKSLMRFKSVHRSWDALFKTNTFIIKQRQRLKEKKGSNYDERFMIFNGALSFDLPFDITLLSCNDPTPFQEVHFPISHPNQKLLQINHTGYCNGVFCLVAQFDDGILPRNKSCIEEAIVWNPATREAKVLPPPPPPPCSDHIVKTLSFYLYGFGATSADDAFFNDLNYVQIFMRSQIPIICRRLGCCYPTYSVVYAQVFNVSSNSWTVIDFTDANISGIRYDFNVGGIYSNGVCHWLMHHLSYVLCFDFHSNKFWKVDTPSPTTTLVKDTILESRDSIAYIAYCKEHFQVEVWILKQEEKYCSSWTKLCTIDALSFRISRIHAIWKDDTEFIGSSASGTLVSYNSRAETLLCFDTFTTGHHHFVRRPSFRFFVYKYMESMIPL